MEYRWENSRTGAFWIGKGLRLDCCLSSLLFAIFILEIDDYLKRTREEETIVGTKKIFILSYADHRGSHEDNSEGSGK